MDINGNRISVYYTPDSTNVYSITNEDGLKIHFENDWIRVESGNKVTMINTKRIYRFTIE